MDYLHKEKVKANLPGAAGLLSLGSTPDREAISGSDITKLQTAFLSQLSDNESKLKTTVINMVYQHLIDCKDGR
jgi:hypothetical protein